jgi:hypothetical protein
MVNESRDAALDRALAQALAVPEVPADLRAAVFAAIAREPIIDWQQQRRDLEKEHRRSLSVLNARYLRRGRDALLAASGAVVLIGLAVKPLSHWLTPLFNVAAPLVAALIALGAGVVSLALILREFLSLSSTEA